MEKQMIARAAQLRQPISATLELTPLCNLDCRMCYIRLNQAEVQARGGMHTADEWIGLAREMARAGVLFVLLTGGEPLLFPEFKKLYLELRRMGMILTLNTNGTLIDERWAAFFKQYPPRRVNITLYGHSAQTYETLCRSREGYDKAVRGIRLLKEAGVLVKINGSVTPANVNEMAAIYALGQELHCPVHMDAYMIPWHREKGRLVKPLMRLSPELAAQARVFALRAEMPDGAFAAEARRMLGAMQQNVNYGTQMTCQAGRSSFAVNWQGQMRPCVTSITPSVSVFDLGFEKAWQQISSQVEKMHIHAQCAVCKLRPLCDTCMANAYWETGESAGMSPYLCRYAKETYRLLLQACTQENGKIE